MVNYTDTHSFGETRLVTPYFGKITFCSQIRKIINTPPPFSYF